MAGCRRMEPDGSEIAVNMSWQMSCINYREWAKVQKAMFLIDSVWDLVASYAQEIWLHKRRWDRRDQKGEETTTKYITAPFCQGGGFHDEDKCREQLAKLDTSEMIVDDKTVRNLYLTPVELVRYLLDSTDAQNRPLPWAWSIGPFYFCLHWRQHWRSFGPCIGRGIEPCGDSPSGCNLCNKCTCPSPYCPTSRTHTICYDCFAIGKLQFPHIADESI
jgi:hypothetical protein